MNNDKLNVMFWNCRSIRNKYIELFDFLLRENIDVCLLSETWLKPLNRLYHPSYNCIRVDRETTGGGVALLIRKTINYVELPVVNTEMIENVGIEIISNTSTNIKIFSTYFPGGSSSRELQRKFNSDLRKLFSQTGHYILCGDMNSRHRNWGCLRANSWGNILTQFTSFFPITILNTDDPTYIPSSSRSTPSTLDLIMTNVPYFVSQPVVANELGSDHLPVKFYLHFSPTLNNHVDLDYSRANWLGYRSFLKNEFKHISLNFDDMTTIQIDENIELLNQKLLRAERLHVPVKINAGNYVKLPNNILNVIKLKNYYRRQWTKYRQQNDRRMMINLSNKIQYMISSFRNSVWDKKITSLKKGDKPFWNISKVLRKKFPSIPTLKNNNEVFNTNEEKSNALAKVFLDSHRVSENIGSQSFDTMVATFINRFDALHTETTASDLVSVEHVSEVIKYGNKKNLLVWTAYEQFLLLNARTLL